MIKKLKRTVNLKIDWALNLRTPGLNFEALEFGLGLGLLFEARFRFLFLTVGLSFYCVSLNSG